ENVSETLELLLYDRYDVIFLDINLMEESGLYLANKINKIQNQLHIIFAMVHDTFSVTAFELDATDYILKPFEQIRIAQAIHKVETALDHDTYKQANDVSQHQNDAHKENTPTSQMVLPIEVDERIHIINLEDIIAISV